MFDFKKIKSDFPIFSSIENFTYLDNAATSHKPKIVIDGMVDFYQKYNANIHRSIYNLSEKATTLYEQAREKIATFINASSNEIVFTSGTTEGINFVADAWARRNLLPGDQIVLTQAEHHANLLPWLRLAKEIGVEIKYIKLNTNTFTLDVEQDLINNKTKFVSLTHSSNVIGDIWDEQNGQLEKVISKAHQVGAKVLLDVAQTVPRRKIDLKKLEVDFLVFSGHKMLAPTGVGVLYIKQGLHEKMEPYRVGGSMVFSVDWQNFEFKKAPYKFEAGTPPIAQAIGLGYAIDYLNNIDFAQLKMLESNLSNILIDGLLKIDGVRILGNLEKMKKSGHLIAFTMDGIHAHDLGAFLGENGVAVRSGNHCAQPLANLLGIDASLRASFYLYNTEQDVVVFLEELNKTIRFFGKHE